MDGAAQGRHPRKCHRLWMLMPSWHVESVNSHRVVASCTTANSGMGTVGTQTCGLPSGASTAVAFDLCGGGVLADTTVETYEADSHR